ncbi:hypothetical protein KDH_12400 [Dictyobacter sp. S3.2.2.5]|uniref:Uncharacterized protein n=2 Tax=Dictyobacter halimunensis TaxID=3026934 RepID=A0ABQ6FNJ6_9CHLR|nr:hypothetical protein KDH_12400 [Dictyobacter sp. S3.2.2.5]
MCFHELLNDVPDDELLVRRLRSVLPAPTRTREGKRAMLSFFRFLDIMIAQQRINREQIQPARVPFFLSAWWYLQDSERWPMFTPLVHEVLMDDPQRSSTAHVIDAYFVFRARFLELSKALELSAWDLEHLLTWYGRQQEARSEKRDAALQRVPALLRKHEQEHVSHPVVLPKTDEEFVAEDEQLIKHEREVHTHVQWLLAKIGHKIGCTVWIAINDHQKTWKHERLGALSLPTLPFFTDSPVQHIIRRIDVLWIFQEKIVAAYEIEHTTNIAGGLLRLYDLGSLCEHAQYLCIVAPPERFQRIQCELARPTFHNQPMYERCQLMSEDLLLEHEEHILRWAGSLSIVESLLHPGDPKNM